MGETTKYWGAGYVTDNGYGLYDFEIKEPHGLLVTPALCQFARDILRLRMGPSAVLVALTPLSGPLLGH